MKAQDQDMIKILERKIEILEDMFENQTRELYMSNQELVKQNQELKHFAYIVSHDLKSPLRSIYSLSHFIKDDIENNNFQDVLDHINTLQERVLRMEGLINGILLYSKIAMEDSVNTNIDLNKLVLEVIDNLERPENFEIKMTKQLPEIVGVESNFIQLFSNIISNSVKYNNKAAGLISIDYLETDEEYEFIIADNGPGILEKYHEKIFVAFQTLNSRDAIESTGIGLSIVKKIVDKLKGSIRLESEADKGVKFYIRIPKV